MRVLFVGYDISYAQFYSAIERELARLGPVETSHVYFRPSASLYSRLVNGIRAASPWVARAFGSLPAVAPEAVEGLDLRFYEGGHEPAGRRLLGRLYSLYRNFYARALGGAPFDLAIVPGEYRLFEQALLATLPGAGRPRVLYFEAGPPGFVYLDERGVNANASFTDTGSSPLVPRGDRGRSPEAAGPPARTGGRGLHASLLALDVAWLAAAALLGRSGDLREINAAVWNALRRFSGRLGRGRAARTPLPSRPYVVFLAQVKNDINHTHFGVEDESIFEQVSAILREEPELALVWRDHPLESSRGLMQSLAARFPGRVRECPGTSLDEQLGSAEGVITVNSNGGLEALHRGLPVRLLGRSYFARVEGACADDATFRDWRAQVRAGGPDARIRRSAQGFLDGCFFPVDYRNRDFRNVELIATAIEAFMERSHRVENGQ